MICVLFVVNVLMQSFFFPQGLCSASSVSSLHPTLLSSNTSYVFIHYLMLRASKFVTGISMQ